MARPIGIKPLLKKTSILLLLFALSACGAGSKWVETKIPQQLFLETIPVDMNVDLMFATVTIKGNNYRFLVDTGAPFSISAEVAKEIDFQPTGSSVTSSSGLRKGRLNHGKINEVNIGPISFKNVTSYVIDFKQSIILDCLGFDGIIGSNLMNSCVWQLDPVNEQIVITDDISRLESPLGQSISMKKVGGQQSPYIPVQINKGDVGYALFDTGSSHFITVTYKSYLSAKKKGKASAIEVLTGRGLGSSGIFGSDDTTQFEIKLNKVKIGKELMHNVVTDMSHTDKTKVGMKFVKGRIVTLDFPNSKFYISPTETANIPKNIKSFGLDIRPNKNNEMIIGSVFENSPAADAGIITDSRVLAVDNIDTDMENQDHCSLFFQVKDHLKNNDTVRITLEEFGKNRQVILQKRVLLN
ncbi:hypothetical protein E1176_12345 [Fulvivirga sp. RKSG066]|uniref:aspartyl protease family protein n=1 Tax=Fulvivirga aurantia TaxID=2529383 RepID=UPI0012BD7880|nr:aspartyl protease family protein [Fulvivirga aurantia]MTI21813.1 hypothetical protein [Fulvivirga aurantia]